MPALIAACRSPDVRVRKYAIRALQEIGPSAKGAVPTLTRALEDHVAGVRVEAAEALWKLDPRASKPERLVRVLVQSLQVPTTREEDQFYTDHRREQAVRVLGTMGPHAQSAVPALIVTLKDNKSWIRKQSAIALGQIGPVAWSAAGPLGEALDDQEVLVSMAAAEALARIEPDRDIALPALQKASRDEENLVRIAAALSLWKLTQQAEFVLPVLLGELRGSANNTAADALGEMGLAAAEAIPPLRKMLKDEHAWARVAAARALWRLERRTDAELEQVLTAALEDPKDAERRFEAAQALWEIHGQTAGLVLVLEDDSYWSRSKRAAEALGDIGTEAKAAVPALVKALMDKRLAVRTAAASALKKIDPEAAAKAGLRCPGYPRPDEN